jgi:hypothetical protein
MALEIPVGIHPLRAKVARLLAADSVLTTRHGGARIYFRTPQSDEIEGDPLPMILIGEPANGVLLLHAFCRSRTVYDANALVGDVLMALGNMPDGGFAHAVVASVGSLGRDRLFHGEVRVSVAAEAEVAP